MSPSGQSSSLTNADRQFSHDDVVNLVTKCFPTSKNLQITNFKLEPFTKETLGFAGVYDLLTVEVWVDDRFETVTFFVKTMSPFANEYQKMIFSEEFKFFKEVMPYLMENYKGRDWAPRCFMARGNVLVLEDLRAQGYKITNKLSDEQLKMAIVSVARLHASSMLLEDKTKRPLNEMCPGYFKEKNFLKKGTNWQFMLAGVEVAETVAKNLKLDPKHILSAYEWLLKEIKTKPGDKNVLCHCDLWCNNVMFDETGKTSRLVDFQQMVYTSYVVDLVQFVHLNVDRETRQRFEIDLLEHYHSELSENLERHGYKGKMIALKELLRDYEKKRVIGLVHANQVLPLALLNSELSKEFTKDDEHFKRNMFKTRRDFVLNAMRIDERYRVRIEEAVEDLVAFIGKFIDVER